MHERDPGRRKAGRDARGERGDYDYGDGGSYGQFGQNEFGGDRYGGGSAGRGPYEQSQQYGGGGFSSGRGDFGALQRQFENRYVSGGHRGSYGDRFGYEGRGDYSGKQHPEEGRFWHADYNPHDTGGRAWNQGPYYGALGYHDQIGPGGRADPHEHRRGRRDTGTGYSGSLGGGSPGELSGAPDWGGAPDWANPNAYHGQRPGPRQPRRRGPKGYRRSDERIHEDVCEQLAHAEHLDVSEVSVQVQDGEVTLEGTVPERRMKHEIEDIVDRCRGVEDIDNRIRVQRPGEERAGARGDAPGEERGAERDIAGKSPTDDYSSAGS